MTSPLLALVSPSRREVLLVLRERGEAWAGELAEALHLSMSALRQTLAMMEMEGLVSSRQVRASAGRPRLYYALTPLAETLFASREATLVRLIDAAAEVAAAGEPLTAKRWGEQVFQQPWAEPMRAARHGAEGERLAAAANAYRASGYGARLEAEGGGQFRLTFERCPVLDLARSQPVMCAVEESFLGDAAGPRGEAWRDRHRLSGDAVCRYRFSFAAEDSPQPN